jgi:PAS domain S-box-containing protein
MFVGFIAGKNIEHLILLQQFKGLFYILLTSALLFILMKRFLGRDIVFAEKLKESEEKFRGCFEISPSLILITDLETGKIMNVNKRFIDTMGYSSDEVIGHTTKEMKIYVNYDEREAAYEQLLNKKYLGGIEIVIRKKNGELRTVDANVKIMDLWGNKVVFCQANDITDQKNAEKELKASEEKYRSIVEMSPTPMHMYELKDDGRLIFIGANPAADHVLGESYQKFVGYPIDLAFPGFAGTEVPILYANIAKGEIGPQVFEMPYNDQNISGIFEVHAYRTGPNTMTSDFFDISDKKAMEKIHNLAQLGQIVAGVAHEIRNPLAIISGNAELSLLKVADKDAVTKNLNIIVNECNNASEIIERMLKFSKPSKDELCKANVNDLIDSIIKLVERQYFLKNVKIERHYAEDLPPIMVNERQMQEVFMNIMNNAVDAMPNGGRISVYTTCDGNNVHMDFVDTGLGIPEGEIHKLFEPFYSTKKTGTGLGLSISMNIIKEHGGTIKVQSQIGAGTTVSVFIPAGAVNA